MHCNYSVYLIVSAPVSALPLHLCLLKKQLSLYARRIESVPNKGEHRMDPSSFHVLLFHERINSLCESVERMQYLRVVFVSLPPFPEGGFVDE